MQDRERSLFDLIGGAAAVGNLLAEFYRRVMADPALAPFFEGVGLDKLKRMQFELFSAALDGPVAYTGRPIVNAHHHLKITLADYQRFVKLLFDMLAEYQLTEQQRYEIVGRLNLYSEDIVSAGTGLVG
jgi:hemoglobin